VSVYAFLSLDKLRQSLIGAPLPAPYVDNDRSPGEIFPNFTSSTTAGPVNFWDWAEGNWVYIFVLHGPFSASFDQLFSYAVGSDILDEAGVKVLGVSRMDLGQLLGLSADVSAIAGRSLTAKLVADPETKLAQRLGLQEHTQRSGATIHRNFLVGPDLRIKSIEVSSLPFRRSCYQTLRLIASMQRTVSKSSQPQSARDLWAKPPAPQAQECSFF